MELKTPSIQERVKRYYSSGPYAGVLALFLIILDILLYIFLSWWTPANTIDPAFDFPHKEYCENKEKFGDHSFNVLEKNSSLKKK